MLLCTLLYCSADAAYNAGCLLERGDPVAKMARAAEIEVRTSTRYFNCNYLHLHLINDKLTLSAKAY
jgi:hypothetical protein